MAKKPKKFKRFHVTLNIDTEEEAKLYYKIFNTATNDLITDPDVTDPAIFVKIKRKLENQGINCDSW